MTGAALPGSRRRVVVLFGGRSAEHDVSCTSAVSVLRALDPAKYEITAVGMTRDGAWVRADDAVKAVTGASTPGELPSRVAAVGSPVQPDEVLEAETVVLPILHGPFGEDGTVQGLLEMVGVPYVGSGVLGSAVSMDKAVAKHLCAAAGIAQAAWLSRPAWDLADGAARVAFATEVGATLGWPAFVKPANLGSSVGVTKAHDAEEFAVALDEALAYDDWIVVEEAITGREIEFSVLGNERPIVSVAGEIVPGKEFYDYDDKYHDDGAKLLIPAPLSPEVLAEGQRLALAVFAALRCEGMARVDFFLEEGGRGWLVNEANTIPGFTPISMYPKLWEASGIGYSELIDRLVELAVARHRRRSGRVGRGREG